MKRIYIEYENQENRPVPLEVKSIGNVDFLKNTENYLVSVESMEFPINNMFMPINSLTSPLNFAIWVDSKSHPELPSGFSYYNISGPLYSVDQALKSLNDVIQKKINLGTFSLDEENYQSGQKRYINFTYNGSDAEKFNDIFIYFDYRLVKLMAFQHDLNDRHIHNGIEYFKFTDFVPSITAGSVNRKQQKYTYPMFYNLKSIRVYSNLPTVSVTNCNLNRKEIAETDLLTDVTFNSREQFDIDNILYIPYTVYQYSMTPRFSLSNVDLYFTYHYADGTETRVILDSLDYCKIRMCFTPIKIEEEINI